MVYGLVGIYESSIVALNFIGRIAARGSAAAKPALSKGSAVLSSPIATHATTLASAMLLADGVESWTDDPDDELSEDELSLYLGILGIQYASSLVFSRFEVIKRLPRLIFGSSKVKPAVSKGTNAFMAPMKGRDFTVKSFPNGVRQISSSKLSNGEQVSLLVGPHGVSSANSFTVDAVKSVGATVTAGSIGGATVFSSLDEKAAEALETMFGAVVDRIAGAFTETQVEDAILDYRTTRPATQKALALHKQRVDPQQLIRNLNAGITPGRSSGTSELFENELQVMGWPYVVANIESIVRLGMQGFDLTEETATALVRNYVDRT